MTNVKRTPGDQRARQLEKKARRKADAERAAAKKRLQQAKERGHKT